MLVKTAGLVPPAIYSQVRLWCINDRLFKKHIPSNWVLQWQNHSLKGLFLMISFLFSNVAGFPESICNPPNAPLHPPHMPEMLWECDADIATAQGWCV